jgi:hypothetical protein
LHLSRQAITALACLQYAQNRWTWYIIAPALPKTHDVEVANFAQSLKTYLAPVGSAASLTAEGYQLVTNHLHGTYAASYALTTYLSTISSVIHLVYLLPIVTGRHDAKEGVLVFAILGYAMMVIDTWQAWSLPRVEQHNIEKDEDED